MTIFFVIVDFSGEFKAPFKSCSDPPLCLSSGKDGGVFFNFFIHLHSAGVRNYLSCDCPVKFFIYLNKVGKLDR